MEKYKNLSGVSGVSHYKIGSDFIELKFKGQPDLYLYTNSITGEQHIQHMKSLALAGKGLSTYISRHPEVKNGYIKQK
jgi:hypothetical protein